ncbi:MAG: dTMP kinase [bacterium]
MMQDSLLDIISFEGVDGVGKTTILLNVYKKLINETNVSYEKILTYPEPYYFKDLLEKFKEDNISLLLLFLLSRRKLLQNIKKQIENKPILVLLDRYIDSTIVYQVLYNKLDLKTFLQFQDIIFFEHQSNYPLITFIFKAEINEIIKRIKSKNNKFLFDNELEIKKIELIQELYLKLPKIFANRIFYIIDTTNESIDSITNKIVNIIKSKIFIKDLIKK